MPETYDQEERPLAISTPLGKDVLLIETISGTEELSRPFAYELSMLANEETDVKFDQVLGQPVTVTLRGEDGPARYVHGIVIALAQGERVESDGGGTTFTRYYADVVPKVWLLSKVVRNRIFQQKTVPEILTDGVHRLRHLEQDRREPTSHGTTVRSTASPTSTSPAG